MLPPLLGKYGNLRTLRYLAITQLGLSFAVLPFIRGRLPESRIPDANARIHTSAVGPRSYLGQMTFWVILLATLVQGLAYFVPILWLPSELRFASFQLTYSD